MDGVWAQGFVCCLFLWCFVVVVIVVEGLPFPPGSPEVAAEGFKRTKRWVKTL